MFTDQLNKQVQEFIISDLETTLHRLGINTQLSVEQEENYKGGGYEVLVSGNFQTFPMLFKSIHIKGSVGIIDKPGEPDDTIIVNIRLSYHYKDFVGGSNGVQLGSVTYEVDKPFNGEEKQTRHISLYVQKVRSLEI